MATKKSEDIEVVSESFGEVESSSNTNDSPKGEETFFQKLDRWFKWLEVERGENLTTKELFLYNEDLKPVEAERRTWSWFNFVFFWIADSFNINTFQIAATSVSNGLSWWVVWISVWVGYGIVGVFVTQASRVGTYYHISFPVSCRASFGIFGALWPIFNRVVMACVWYGVQSAIAAQTVNLMLRSIFGNDLEERIPNKLSGNITSFGMLCFFIFWFLSLPAIYMKPHKVRHLFTIKAYICPACGIAFLVWTILKAGGIGPVVHQKSSLTGSAFGWEFINSVMNCIANFATLIVNAPDFSRMAKTKNSAIWSQLITIPLSFSVTCLIGVLISSASTVMYGETFWNPLDVLSRFLDGYSRGDRAGVFLISFGFAIAQLGTNISANSISAGTDMTAILPKYLNIRRGGFICACVGYAICPWSLVSSSSMFTTYLSAYAVFLSSISGVVFSDYYLVRRGFLHLPDLYSGKRSGAYAYSKIYCNYRAYIAYICGIVPNITGFVGATKTHVVPLAATRVYQLSYFVGFLAAALVYFLCCCYAWYS
ncbi:unnamed protein product [[Candida] boidinii]|nr:unnamed protein product [[Candida] boidinii]